MSWEDHDWKQAGSENVHPTASPKSADRPGNKTAIVTGAERGIGAGLGEAFLSGGYNVVGTSCHVTQALTAAPNLVLIDGDIGKQETSVNAIQAATERFGGVDVLVNNAGILRNKPFTDFTTDDFNAFVSTNLLGFVYMTQLAVRRC